jgi:peptidoglycan/xylan/chitin deacetylase (PgdA/CDA1 family)
MVITANVLTGSLATTAVAVEPVPDKLVVLTFDDAVESQFTVVRPLLKKFGFGATFFITEGFSKGLAENSRDYLTWDQVAELHLDGFEIGNHTRDHLGVSTKTLPELREQVEAIAEACVAHGIPRPISFAYPGNAIVPDALPILNELGIKFARRGGAPEHPYEWGRGQAFAPGRDHPLLIPSAGDARPDWTLDNFKQAVELARGGRIAVIQFHGVPEHEHPWVHTSPDRFAEYLQFLHDGGYKVVALRDLARYVAPDQVPPDPLDVIEERKAARRETLVEVTVTDAATEKPVACRVTIRDADGGFHFPKSANIKGSAIRYEKRSGFNRDCVEMHATLSAHPFRVELLPGRYTITVERGKEFFPESRTIDIAERRTTRRDTEAPKSATKPQSKSPLPLGEGQGEGVVRSTRPHPSPLPEGEGASLQARLSHGTTESSAADDAERGKPTPPVRLTIPLRRWIDMASRGWWSGDAHNHRQPADLPNVMLAEDVNVGLPMVQWTTESTVPPSVSTKNFRGDFGRDPIEIDDTHVWYPRNTEYEIFRTADKQHTLGAVLIVNHREPFDLPTFPLKAIAERARSEAALIDLEKHNWPWSIAVVPLLNVDLYELANNHHWQTQYGIRGWAEPAAPWMDVRGSGTDTELDWTMYGFQTYYALLNCGFRLRPTAGTANGVHPVPLGFSRVYVQLDEPFTYDAWTRGLGAGRSFVTNGPVLLVQIDGQWPGHTFSPPLSPLGRGAGGEGPLRVIRLTGQVVSERPLRSIECVANGRTIATIIPQNEKTADGANLTRLDTVVEIPIAASSWIAVRCWEDRPAGRFRFAHTAPWHFPVEGKPNRPRRQEIDWLISRVRNEIERSQRLLPPAGLDEYRKSLAIYEEIAKRAE